MKDRPVKPGTVVDGRALTKYGQLACIVCFREPPIGMTNLCHVHTHEKKEKSQ